LPLANTSGPQAINDRIKELDFHETKVRVTNVDSQGSDANIVIQVIGEISNRGQPHKRFVQTFVLAAQTNGYFVLNDIFRYLAEEPEEEEELQNDSTASATGMQEPTHTAAVQDAESAESTPNDEDLSKIDQKLEDAAEEPTREASPPPAAVNGTPVPEDAEVVEAEEAPVAAVSTSEEASSKEPEAPVVKEETEPVKPKEPAPAPVSAPTKAAAKAASKAAAPPKPTAPRTWASLAASAHRVAMPAVPTSSAPQAPSQPKAAAPASSQPLAVPAQGSTPAREPSPANSQGEASGWQTAGPKKEPARGVQNQTAAEAEQKRAYIKNVYSQVEEGALRTALTKFGEIEYLDISRPKVRFREDTEKCQLTLFTELRFH